MTTYGPDPDVPTAAVLPADVCVIAPPVTATSTVLRIPNCPVIRWTASRCREPSVLAFAVRRTSGVNARRVGSVDRSGFGSPCGSRWPGGDTSGPRRIASKAALSAGDGADHNVVVRLQVVQLPGAQYPRICSGSDVRRGCGGDRPRLQSGFPSMSAPLGCCRTTPHRHL